MTLESTGFRNEAFDRDDVGYITHIIPPREPDPRESNITWLSLDAENCFWHQKPKDYMYLDITLKTFHLLPRLTLIDWVQRN